jgi:hypothetical protein
MVLGRLRVSWISESPGAAWRQYTLELRRCVAEERRLKGNRAGQEVGGTPTDRRVGKRIGGTDSLFLDPWLQLWIDRGSSSGSGGEDCAHRVGEAVG